MTVKRFVSVLITVITSNLISPSVSDPQTDSLINQICRQTADFAFCSDVLTKNIVSPNTDLAGLTRLTIKLSLNYANDTKIFIQKAKANEKNLKLQQLYDVCESNYQQVVGFMEGANFDVGRADYDSMVNLLKLCGKPIIFCQNAIGDAVLAMRDRNRHVRVFLTMGLYEGSILLN